MTALHPGLDHAFPPAFARFAGTLRPPQADAVSLPHLLGAAQLPRLARRYATLFPGQDGRAALSFWSQHYLLALIPCATASALVGRQDLPLALAGMAAVLTETGQPACLCLPHAGSDSAEPCPVRRLTPLLRTHLEPLAAALAGAGLPRPVFWSNAAAILGWSLRVLAAPPPRCAAVREAMTAPCWTDDGPNPFCAVLGADPARRRVCCLRFRLGGVARCGDCPGAPAPHPLG